MTQPAPLIVPVPQISWRQGIPEFVRLSDVYDAPGIDMFEVTAITDYACMLRLSWERTNPPANPGASPLSGTVDDAGPVTNHRLTVPAGSIAQQPRQQIAQEVRYTIGLSPSDSSTDAQGARRVLREYVGTLKLRQAPWNFVPVRFYNFGDTPPPPPGGDEGDWNTYAWAQYNPSGQPFGHVNFAYFDLNGTNGTEVFPAARVFARLPAPSGAKIAVQLRYPVPNLAASLSAIADPLQSAEFEVSFDPANEVLRERFCWKVPQPGELDPVEALIRATAESKLVRIARLITNPGPTQTYLGANYWLTGQADQYLIQH